MPVGKLSPETASARSKVGRRLQSFPPDHPRVIEARHDLELSKLADHIKEVISTWPDIPAAKLDRVADLLRTAPSNGSAPGPGARPLRERVKPCTRCGEPLPLTDFGPDARARDGRRSCCRACESREKARRKRSNKPLGLPDQEDA